MQTAAPPVAITRAKNYGYDEIKAAVNRQFALLGVAFAITPGMRVTLKPNLLMKRTPERFTTTHPMLVRCVAEALFSLGAKEVRIADSPGGPFQKGLLEGIYQASGMAEAAAKSGAKLSFDTGFSTVKAKDFHTCPTFNLIRSVTDTDLLINLPKIKTHGMITYSGAVKNLFGCIPGLQKPELHFKYPERDSFCNMLVDLALTLPPAFTIADAVISMEGDGPSSGTPRKTGFLAGCVSPFYLDEALTGLLGLTQVPTVSLAQERGLVTERAVLLGDALDPISPFIAPKSASLDFISRLPAFLQPPAARVSRRITASRPEVIKKKCVGCKKCMESCPAHVIEMKAKAACISKKGCISCFCCQEFCPVGAIRIKRFVLFNW